MRRSGKAAKPNPGDVEPAGSSEFEAARAAMVRDQLRAGGIEDERVLAAMAEVPREEFVPPRWRGRAYDDGALPIGHGQTISQPWVVAAICAALALRGDEHALDVGAGSGYSTAVLARLAERVTGVELVPELAERASEVLRSLGIENARVVAGDGAADPPAPDDRELYDAIAVHAAAPAVPPRLAAALRPGGVLVAPVAEDGGEMLTAFRRTADEEGPPRLVAQPIARCRFVPLLGEAGYGRGR